MSDDAQLETETVMNIDEATEELYGRKFLAYAVLYHSDEKLTTKEVYESSSGFVDPNQARDLLRELWDDYECVHRETDEKRPYNPFVYWVGEANDQ